MIYCISHCPEHINYLKDKYDYTAVNSSDIFVLSQPGTILSTLCISRNVSKQL